MVSIAINLNVSKAGHTFAHKNGACSSSAGHYWFSVRVLDDPFAHLDRYHDKPMSIETHYRISQSVMHLPKLFVDLFFTSNVQRFLEAIRLFQLDSVCLTTQYSKSRGNESSGSKACSVKATGRWRHGKVRSAGKGKAAAEKQQSGKTLPGLLVGGLMKSTHMAASGNSLEQLEEIPFQVHPQVVKDTKRPSVIYQQVSFAEPHEVLHLTL
jgi:hypothetical protein